MLPEQWCGHVRTPKVEPPMASTSQSIVLNVPNHDASHNLVVRLYFRGTKSCVHFHLQQATKAFCAYRSVPRNKHVSKKTVIFATNVNPMVCFAVGYTTLHDDSHATLKLGSRESLLVPPLAMGATLLNMKKLRVE